MSHRLTLGIVGILGLVGISCAADHQHEQGAAAVKAVAQIGPTKGNNVKGTVTFTQEGDRVRIVAHVTGLKANSEHGFHIHEGSECGEDGMAAGGHYNPDNHPHGPADPSKYHAGDLGNLKADADGVAHLELTLQGITVNGAKNPIVNRTIMVHAGPDDLKSQPTGNSGGRIGCGVIKLVESK